ncbi:MAG: hypothetical protein PHO26_06415 [Dehalococcoidia bacterium]|nr:hypothetical protein [Dehalococcoidia bacterium]MDD5493436.1 hypothetical protein [Dehalococcoidia bacterium]
MKPTWKPIMAGILDIVSGAIGMVGGIYFVILSTVLQSIHEYLNVDPAVIQTIQQFISSVMAIPFILVFVGIAAIIGGVYALQRRIWVFALGGAVFSFILFFPFGLASIIVTAMSREEFS